MLGLLGNLGHDPQLDNYPERCEEAAAEIAEACGLDGARERERFRWCREHLARQRDAAPAPASTRGLLDQLTALTSQQLPLLFEFVLSHPATGAPRFSYLTQGQPAATLTRSMSDLLTAVLEMHVKSNGDPAVAERLANQFRIAFPGLSGLEAFSPSAQAMLVGVVPAGDRADLKVYFNTRMDTTTPHHQRVVALLESCGLTDDGSYGLLYEQTEDASFHGFGVDLSGGRAKLYVHVPRERVSDVFERLGHHLYGESDAGHRVLEPIDGMLNAIDSEALVDELEVAVALRRDGPTSAKLTAFLSPQRADASDVERVAAYLEDTGHDTAPLRRALRVLSRGVPSPTRQAQPIRAVGVETPVGERTKVNIYLQATM